MTPLAPLLLLCSLALVVTLIAQRREQPIVGAISKLLASSCFVAIAWLGGALELDWGRPLLLGLVLGLVGDVCLLGKQRRFFVAGLVAFLLGHLAYCVAFVVHGIDVGAALLALTLLLVPLLVIDRWLDPHVPTELRVPVRAYLIVITLMLGLALAAWQAGASVCVLLGALAFFVSDLAVARDRFVVKQFSNRLWGLPAYYLGQVLLASWVMFAA